MTGSSVKALQEALNASGANLEVDGIFGPATEAAVTKYQKDNGYDQIGVVPNALMRELGVEGGTTSGAGGSAVATSKTGSDLLLPASGVELWYDSDTKQYLVVQKIPPVEQADGTMTEELYVSWTVESDDDLEAVIGPDVDPKAAKIVSEKDLTKLGVVNFGGIDEMRDWEGIIGDPLTTWEEDMATLAITRPWVLEPEWQQLAVMAIMERDDAQLSEDEIQGTEWYRTHSDLERDWMVIANGDPATAERWELDSKAATARKLELAGINNVPQNVSDYMAMQVVMGHWSPEMLDVQIRAISDPFSNAAPDKALIQEMGNARWTPDATQEKEDVVRAQLQRWLGPVYGAWSDKAIAQKAGDLRNDPDAEVNFIESLKDQRLAVLGQGSDDRNVSYEDLARPWRAFQQQAWGTQEVDETDPMFYSMLRHNDAQTNGMTLQVEGLKRNIGKVVTDTKNALYEGFGGAVR
jgi:peptidoglycan hydrolase-like protein with peptidoglycan-binding domain